MYERGGAGRSGGGFGEVIVVPYIQFHTDQVASSVFGCKVAQSIRQQLNQKVLAVNNFIQDRTSRCSSTFIDKTALQSAYNGHRFCDSGPIWIEDSMLSSLSSEAQQQWNSNGTLPAEVNAALNSTFSSNGDYHNGDDNSGLFNTFHPTFQGHTTYYHLVAGAIIAPVSNTNDATFAPINTTTVS